MTECGYAHQIVLVLVVVLGLEGVGGGGSNGTYGTHVTYDLISPIGPIRVSQVASIYPTRDVDQRCHRGRGRRRERVRGPENTRPVSFRSSRFPHFTLYYARNLEPRFPLRNLRTQPACSVLQAGDLRVTLPILILCRLRSTTTMRARSKPSHLWSTSGLEPVCTLAGWATAAITMTASMS